MRNHFMKHPGLEDTPGPQELGRMAFVKLTGDLIGIRVRFLMCHLLQSLMWIFNFSEESIISMTYTVVLNY